MSIIDSIQKARKKEIKDNEILQEIIRQNPKKGKIFTEALEKGVNPTQILNEIIKKNIPAFSPPEKPKKEVVPPPVEKTVESPLVLTSVEAMANKKISEGKRGKTEEERRIEEARKRIEVLKKEVQEREKKEQQEQKEKEVKKVPPSQPAPPITSPPQKPIEIIRPVPKKPSFREKLWVRVSIFSLVLVLLAAVSTFWYWYLVIRVQPPVVEGCITDADCPIDYICGPDKICVSKAQPPGCTTDADCPENYICGQDKICATKPQPPAIPPPLFSVEDTRVLSISLSEELRSILLQTTQEWLDTDQFRRIVIKKTPENKILGLKDFFEAMLIRVPEELYQKLENDFTLFLYSQSEGNRLGLAVRITNLEELNNLLKSRESTMESDFQTFFELMGKTGPAIVPYFRNANNVRGYVGPNFRFQTLTRQDLGICYLISSNYFVFTSSWKSTEKVINRIAISAKPVELTTDLKIGDRGTEVELLQTWLKQDSVIYPQGLVTGFFGRLTQAAIIRFQERYASEILAPQGLIHGTGILDSYTRIKLNELYSTSGVIPPKPEITTDLRFGDHGDEIKLLQTWLAKDEKVYPEGITSGWFGPLTRAAVTRFQEKYASEILTIQGLTRGTGIVDALTRKKLNELYGE